jgi:tetratricopeptide (TPR) repeat protein
MPDPTKFRSAMSASTKLLQQDKNNQALGMVDEAIEEAVRDGDNSWVRTLCHHAAIIARFTENLDLAKYYYEQSLASNPENAQALYGLARVYRDQGRPEVARIFAKRCHDALMRDDTDILKPHLLESLSTDWPEVTRR